MRVLPCCLLLATALARADAPLSATGPAPTASDGTAGTATVDTPPATAHAPESLPRWELGVSLVGAYLRDYPGSSHFSSYALPLPWFIWRSDRIELGREGGRGRIYRTLHTELDFVASANPPSGSDDNPERAGMQKLDAVLEPGLRLRWRYPIDPAGRWHLGLQLPLRYALAVGDNFHLRGLGLHGEPGVSLDHTLAAGWYISGYASVGYADAGYSDYYYGVAPVDATPTRPVYDADGGYAGWRAGTRLSWRRGNIISSLFLRYENIANAAFADSPLVTRDDGYTIGGSLSWSFARSREHLGAPTPLGTPADDNAPAP